MIEIKSAAPEETADLCRTFAPQADAAMMMVERGERIGFVCMKQEGETATLFHLEAPDDALTDALFRAALNTARASGAKTAVMASDSTMAHMLRRGYGGEENGWVLKISDFFSKSSCKA